MKTRADGELEMQVMDILWTCHNCTINDVWQTFRKKHKIAYTTVATILHRLLAKGLVGRKKDKNYHIYFTTLSKEAYSSNVVNNFLDKAVRNFGDVALTSFAAGIDRLPKEKRNHFVKLLQKYENK